MRTTPTRRESRKAITPNSTTMRETAMESMLLENIPNLQDSPEVLDYISSYVSDYISLQSGSSKGLDNDEYEEDRLIETITQLLGERDDVHGIVTRILSVINDIQNSHSPSKEFDGEASSEPTTIKSFRSDTQSSAAGTSGDDNEPPSPSKSKRAKRKESTRQRRHNRKRNSKNKNHDKDGSDGHADEADGSNKLKTPLAGDHDSAWKDCQTKGVLWGGRGHGGRGIRSTQNLDSIHLHSVSLQFAGNELLTDSPLISLRAADTASLVETAWGKVSTLLTELARQAIPGMPHGMRILLVQQQIEGSTEQSALDALVQSDVDRLELLQEQEEIERRLEEGINLEQSAERLGEIVAELDAIDADLAEDRALTILKGLSFTDAMIYGETINLSGGWRMRLALAQALFIPSSDLILLDECTNHLDLYGLAWLINYIENSEHTIMIVSHDRSFLDAVCTDIVIMEHKQLNYFVGNYSDYQQQVEEKAAREAQILDAADRQRSKALAFVQKQQAMANKKSADPNKQRQAKMIKDKKLDRIGNYREDGRRYQQNSLKKLDMKYARFAQKVHIEVDDPVLRLRFPNPTWPAGVSVGAPIVTLEEASFSYIDIHQPLLNRMTLNVTTNSKVAIVGRNGSGKSTLLKLLTGDIDGMNGGHIMGVLWRHPLIRMGHVSQYSIEELEEHKSQTVMEYAEKTLSSGKASSKIIAEASGNIRQYLGGFGLGGAHALRKIGMLSGGERMRLCFATVLANEPHILILDESTNHVDLETLDSLADALDEYKGAVLMVSHNQGFLSRFCKELWVVNDDGTVTCTHDDTATFDEMFSQYKSSVVLSGEAANRANLQRTKAALATKAMKQSAGARTTTALI